MKDYRSYPGGGEALETRTKFEPNDIISTPGEQIFDPQLYPFLRKALSADSLGCFKDNGTLELEKLTAAETTALFNSLTQHDKEVMEKEKNDLRTPPQS